jgi:hypothetical protein
MSHLSVLVPIGPCSREQLAEVSAQDVFERIEERLRRHWMNPYWIEPRDDDGASVTEPPPDWEPAFDWFQIGGRWRGHFVAKTGNLFLGAPGTPESLAIEGGRIADPSARLLRERRTDVVLAGDIDWAAMRSNTLTDGSAWYDECARDGRGLDGVIGSTPTESRSAYLARIAAEYSPATYAICDANGWREAPWYGGPVEWREWLERWEEYVLALDGDTLLALVDCHQ